MLYNYTWKKKQRQKSYTIVRVLTEGGISKNASVKHKKGWSDEYIQYSFEIFCDKDAQKLKGQCVICTRYTFLGIASSLIMTNLSRT